MTVIIGIKHKWDVYVASDWRITAWDKIESDKFIKQFESHWATIAVAWEIWIYNALKYLMEVKFKDSTAQIKNEHDIYLIYSELYKHLREYWMIDVGSSLWINIIIITKNGRLFNLDWFWTVMERKWLTCAGSGWMVAEAILSQMIVTNPERDIKYVMKEVFKMHCGTGWNINIAMYPWKKTLSKINKALTWTKLKKKSSKTISPAEKK